MWGDMTAEGAYLVLSKPDVVVTNQSDKEAQLPKILKLNETIKLAQQRLEEMTRQREELGQAIDELAGQIEWAEKELEKARHDDAA